MAELVDAPDLGSGAERRESSSISFRTKLSSSSRRYTRRFKAIELHSRSVACIPNFWEQYGRNIRDS